MPPPQIVMRRSGGGVLRSSRGLQRTMQRGAFARCEASRRKRLLPLFAAEYCRVSESSETYRKCKCLYFSKLENKDGLSFETEQYCRSFSPPAGLEEGVDLQRIALEYTLTIPPEDYFGIVEAVGWIIISIWWKCPRDKVECDNKADLTIAGWVIFGILMASHLLRDLVNGSKMIVLCAEHGYSLPSRLRFFLGGLFLNTVTAFTLFSSTIYNKAIATSY